VKTVSIALCTYNGERYIEEQLRSIFAQQTPVDEIVVSDDGSSDRTLQIVQRVAEQATGRNPEVRIHRGRRGITKNFEYAVEQCRGDVIFLCDQDDVWERDKVAQLTSALDSDPGALLAFSDATLIDARGARLGSTQYRAARLGHRELALFGRTGGLEILLSRSVVTGATVAFRRELLRWAIPFHPKWLHDEWLAIVAAMFGRVIALPAALTRYRQHSANQLGIGGVSGFEKLRDAISAPRLSSTATTRAEKLHALAILATAFRGEVAPDRRALLDDCLAFQMRREGVPRNGFPRLLAIAALGIRGAYASKEDGMRILAKDLIEAARRFPT